jgi:hypothetical protein
MSVSDTAIAKRIQLTLGETRSQKTGNLLDQRVGGDEGIVLARKFLTQVSSTVRFLC